jgi:Ca-activated chloride channel family protein
MPKLPVSIAKKVVIGVGDPREGSFIDGRHSRQQASVLRQLAIRLGGVYHDGNDKQVSSDVIRAIVSSGETAEVTQLSRREFALLAVVAGALVLSLLPLALQYLGTRWRPGVHTGAAATGNDFKSSSDGRTVRPVAPTSV